MKIVVAAAMQEELAPFYVERAYKTVWKQGKCRIDKVVDESSELYFVETGIGKANAAFSATVICERLAPELLINTGSAGALSRKLSVGDVVIADRLGYSDVDATGFDYAYGQVPQMPAEYLLAENWKNRVMEEIDMKNIHFGQIVTADSFMSSAVLVRQVQERFPKALATDMESTAIAQIASFYQVPVLNIRGISDMAGQQAAETFDKELNTAAINAHVVVQGLLQALIK